VGISATEKYQYALEVAAAAAAECTRLVGEASHFQPYLNQRCKANIYYDRSDTSKSENVFPFQRKRLTNTPDHFLLQFPSISPGFAKYFPMCRHNRNFSEQSIAMFYIIFK
jgi:hypothetical protein